MKALGLDLAQISGWAFGENFASAHFGVWKLPGLDDKNINRSLGSLYSAVNGCCRANGIELVVIESALMGIMKKNKRGIVTPTSRHGDRVLGMLSGAARAGAANAGVKHLMFPGPSTWRAQVLGHGYPDDPKGAAVRYCALMGKTVSDHNAAEGLCIMQYGLASPMSLLERIKA